MVPLLKNYAFINGNGMYKCIDVWVCVCMYVSVYVSVCVCNCVCM